MKTKFETYQRVIVRRNDKDTWHASYFSHCCLYSTEPENIYYVTTDGNVYGNCLPYNKNTKHLIGTTNEYVTRIRVNEGEFYYSIDFNYLTGRAHVLKHKDCYVEYDKILFNTGNYFDKDTAEQVAKDINTILDAAKDKMYVKPNY